MVDENSIRLRYEAMHACLDERGRLFAAADVRTAGRGIAAAARATARRDGPNDSYDALIRGRFLSSSIGSYAHLLAVRYRDPPLPLFRSRLF